ncbi:MAG: protein-L-isoaspartate O-methyltransferase [Gammaproteobacteria bacterium]
MNFEQARLNMIEQQIRTWEVLNQQVLDLLAEIHREDFVPGDYKQLALADTRIPLLHDQITMTPKEEARLLQSVDIHADDKVLEIGTGCAYLTALLASSASEVVSIDIHPEFTQQARNKLDQYHINNVSLETGDAINGWEKSSPYDVVIVTGSVPALASNFQRQLKLGGRLFVIVGKSPVMEATLLTRIGDNEWSRETLFETDLPPLIGISEKIQFFL